MDISQALKFIDCNESEINTFLALLERKSGTTVVQLSRSLNLPRPTIYGHLNSLVKKGIVRKSLGEMGARFSAESLEHITQVFEERSQHIKQAKESLKTSLETPDIPEYQPKFVVFDTLRAAESVFRDVVRTGEKETYWFWPVKEMIKRVPPEVFLTFTEERVKRNIWLNVLWPEKKSVDLEKYKFLGSADPKKSLRRVRILPGKLDYTMGYGIYGNKVAFISSQREHYGYVIDSKELSDTMRSQFDYFWKISKKHTG